MSENFQTPERFCLKCNSRFVCKIYSEFTEQVNIFSGYLSSKEYTDKVPGSIVDLWSALAGICTQFTPLIEDQKPIEQSEEKQ